MVWRNSVLVLCVWLGTLLLGTASTPSNILSSLSDLDFLRIRSDQAHHASEQDSPPTLTLTRQLLGAGYHRELRVNIKVDDLGSYTDNKFLLVENITRDTYIDLDQIASTGELGPRILSSAHMDTEKPASASRNHVVLFYTRLIDNTSDVRFPIHFRYQPPSAVSPYATVVLPAPLVLMQHPVGSASLPCHPHTRDTCLWKLLTPTSEEEGDEGTAELRAEIPRGEYTIFSPFVVGFTSVIAFLCTAVVLYSMARVESYQEMEE